MTANPNPNLTLAYPRYYTRVNRNPNPNSSSNPSSNSLTDSELAYILM